MEEGSIVMGFWRGRSFEILDGYTELGYSPCMMSNDIKMLWARSERKNASQGDMTFRGMIDDNKSLITGFGEKSLD